MKYDKVLQKLIRCARGLSMWYKKIAHFGQ